MFRQLGLQVSFNSGDCALLRGHEMSHSATLWTAATPKDRYCCVFTNHESIKRTAQGKPAVETIDDDIS